MRRSKLLTAVALTTGLAACGTQSTDDRSSESTTLRDTPPSAPVDGPVRVADGEVLVSCRDDTGWAPSVMTDGVPDVLSDADAAALFEGILADPATGEEAGLTLFPDGVDVDWRVLAEHDGALTIGLGAWTADGPDQGAHVLDVERAGEDWRVAGWGDCRLAPVLGKGHTWVEVTGYQGDPADTRLTAQVSERTCTSGRDPGAFLHEPLVVETDEEVTLYWTSEPATGGQDCQGNPSIDRVVDLAQPLGARMVVDGSSYPPREVPARGR